MGLETGHSGSGVVEDEHGDLSFIKDGVDQRGQAGMEESGVAHVGDDGGIDNPGEAVGDAESGAHAEGGVHGFQRGVDAHAVAADIAGEDSFDVLPHFFSHVAGGHLDGVMGSPVGAASAEDRRPGGEQRGSRFHGAVECPEVDGEGGAGEGHEGFHQLAGRELADDGEEVFTVDLDVNSSFLGEDLDMVFDERFKLFGNEDFPDRRKELFNQDFGEGIRSADLEYGNLIIKLKPAQGFHGIAVGDAGGDDAQAGVRHEVKTVIGQGIGGGLDIIEALNHEGLVAAGFGGGINEAEAVLDESALTPFFIDLTQHNIGAAVADAGDGADHEHLLKLFGQFKGVSHHVLGFLDGGGLEDGDITLFSDEAVVLLVLGTPRPGVIGDEEYETAGHLDLVGDHEGVVGNIQADVLHGGEGAAHRRWRRRGRSRRPPFHSPTIPHKYPVP